MDFSGLNSEQEKAVKLTEGPLLILAGAGSGKTTTMTHRIAYMIEQGVDPYRILAVTFTNKAAGEMRDRVSRLTPYTKGIWIMTFHAMCLRMLRYQSEKLDYKNGFTVYDETDRKSLIKRILKEKNVDEKLTPPVYFQTIISNCKEAEEDPELYYERNADGFNSKIIYEVYSEYQKELMKNNAMDFDDLLWNGVKLLEENADVREHYSNRFKYVMVDEYQDTNHLQYKLIQILASKHRNLCVVGDDDQCIYQWRGADISNILDFEKDFPEVKTVKLEQNYRSDRNILALANSVIKNNSGRKKKSLWTDKEDGAKITYHRCEDEKREAWYIGEEIEKLHKEGYRYGDMAILYRTNAQSRSFEEKFSFRGLPYRVLAGTRYYDRKEIKDVMAYLRLIDNPEDDVAMLRVINEPKRGMGSKSLSAVSGYARAYQMSIFEALHQEEVIGALSKRASSEITSFVAMIDELRSEQENLTIANLYDNIISRSGYLKALEDSGTIESDSRIENIMEFKSVIGEFEEKLKNGELDDYEEEMEVERKDLASKGLEVDKPSTLGSFLEKITLMADIDNRDENEDAVVLMTMHSAKGLEFPILFLPGLENGLFPGIKSLTDANKLEEERRLCYVGITRAMKKLYLTSAETRMLYGRTDYTTESVFLDEMDKELLDGDKTVKDRIAEGGGLSGEGGLLGERFFKGKTFGTNDGYSGAPQEKPFDTLKYSTHETKKKISNDGFETGDILKHPKFGNGMLIEQDQKTMTIMFDSVGQKKIGKGFVVLEKVDD